MNEDLVTKVLALFDVNDINYIKAKMYLEYEKQIKDEKYVKKLGDNHGNGKRKMGKIFIPKK